MGAADAAFTGSSNVLPDGPVRKVTDQQLEAMATIEFEPPRDIRPWQGALLLAEKVDSRTVSAWFSDQIAQGVIELNGATPPVLTPGPQLDTSPPVTRERITALFDGQGELELGKYQSRLATLWSSLEAEQRQVAVDSGWWTKHAPGKPRLMTAGAVAVLVGFVAVFLFAAIIGLGQRWPFALAFAFLLPALVAYLAYRPLLPVRSAAGSAAALRTESFRRFLHASEAQHVEWAWKHGLLREYSAWAVALGEAAAWRKAVDVSAVPPAEAQLHTTPMLLYLNSTAWNSSHVAPVSSSGHGFSGGGFSGGFGGGLGGGGGGGSSGSW